MMVVFRLMLKNAVNIFILKREIRTPKTWKA